MLRKSGRPIAPADRDRVPGPRCAQIGALAVYWPESSGTTADPPCVSVHVPRCRGRNLADRSETEEAPRWPARSTAQAPLQDPASAFPPERRPAEGGECSIVIQPRMVSACPPSSQGWVGHDQL
jgi:hypothetical protein